MSSAGYARVKALFLDAVELEGAERERFIAESCDDEGTLRHELEALLAADHEDLELERPFAEQAARFVDASLNAPPDIAPDRRLGAYRILHEIGCGGMSTVYLAVRDDDQYQQRVAIKLIRDGLGSDDRHRRFLQERQILAGLDHPNIARLLDGGTTADGLPYVVLEYVEGLPIDTYCDRHRLSINERLALFCDVCSAVHAAHQNLVIHRDLKPGNVLVTAGGVPKLLDFGIAKLLNPELSARELQTTLPNFRLMTPAYASPEQIRGEPVTTASDVYSLGVMLYQLLTGRAPYVLDGVSRDEVERVICETEPRPPSTAVSSVAPEAAASETLGSGAAGSETLAGSTQPEAPSTLRRRLAGDLDAIVLMALRKEPQRRYGSAEQLAEDLRRTLGDQPVRARRDTLRYRTGKFLRRNRWVPAAMLIGLVFSIGMTVQTLRLSAALQHAVMQEQEARGQRDRAESVSDFLVRLFRTSDPNEARGRTLTARELLDQASWRIDAELESQPALKATLMDTMGVVYQNLGFFDEAGSLLVRAFEMRRQLAPGADADVAQSLSHLAFLRHLEEDFTTAEVLARQALEMRREMFGAEHPLVAESQHDLAEVLFASGEWDDSETHYRSALAMRQELLGPQHRAVAESLNEMSMLLRAKDQYDEADAMASEALEIWRESFGDDHPEVATALENVALVRVARGDLESSEALLRQALDIKQRLLGDAHPGVAETAAELGSVVAKRGDLATGESLLRQSLATALLHWGEESPRVANHQSRLAAVLAERGSHAAAAELGHRALVAYRQTFGADHPWTALQMSTVARYRRSSGDIDGAITFYRDAVELWRRVQPDGSWDFAYGLIELGRILDSQGDSESAEALFRESLLILHRVLPGHWRIAEAEHELAVSLARQGRFDEAEPLLARGWSQLSQKLPADQARDLRQRLSEIYAAQGRVLDAEWLVGL